jgi:hypothetical protein
MRRVIIESPYAGDIALHQGYLRACLLDCLRRGEAPFASHGLYTQCLNDKKPKERDLGIKAGFEWRFAADCTVVYADLGISKGMQMGIDHAKKIAQAVEVRKLGGEWSR